MPKKKEDNTIWWVLGGAALLAALSAGDKGSHAPGFFPQSVLDQYPLLANNNPTAILQTDINWIGSLPVAETPHPFWEGFNTPADGYRAAVKNADSIINAYGKPTVPLSAFIGRWATGDANGAPNYAEFVSNEAGIHVNANLASPAEINDPDLWWSIMRAMSIFESGANSEPFIDELENEFRTGYDMAYAS